jgi:pimeloyl-ACP methyl ester carboxylesterase
MCLGHTRNNEIRVGGAHPTFFPLIFSEQIFNIGAPFALKVGCGIGQMSWLIEDNVLWLADGRRLGYGEYGDPEGWPLVFFHGTPGSRVMARFAATRAWQEGVRLIAPERPGFGLSDLRPQRRLLDWVEDVAELADALNLERFAVAGVSGGGPYVAACAWKMPARLTAAGIISGLAPVDRVRGELNNLQRLSAVLVRVAPGLVNLVLGLLARSARRRPEWIIRSMRLVAPWGDRRILARPEVQQTQIDGIRESFRRGPAGAAYEAALLTRPWGFEVKEIKVPVHLWHGEADAIVPVGMGRYLAENIPRCRARFIPRAGHLWIFEGYEEVFRVLRQVD